MSTDFRADLVRRDKMHVWHPYTAMGKYKSEASPIVVRRAAGSRLYDADGRSIIDGNAQWWTSLLGHNHPRLVRRLREQSEKFCHVSLAGVTHEPAIRLAERLVEVAPAGLDHVFFSDNGSTSVEVALKMAVQFFAQKGGVGKEKYRFLSLENGFHGETLGAASLSHVPAFQQGAASYLLPVQHLVSPADNEDAALDDLESALKRDADRLAALVVEPLVQGAGGMRFYPPSYLSEARRLTKKHDVLLIVDEVFTGYGRLGSFWASEKAAICPDILCTAKGLSGGLLPFAATLTSGELFDGFLGDASRALYYGHTYCGNPLGAAVALEVLDVYEDEKVLEGISSRAQKIDEAFRALGQLPQVSGARALGMCAALNLGTQEGYLQRAGWDVYERALRRGVYLRPLGDVVYMTPALNIAHADLDELLSVMDWAVREVAGGAD